MQEELTPKDPRANPSQRCRGQPLGPWHVTAVRNVWSHTRVWAVAPYLPLGGGSWNLWCLRLQVLAFVAFADAVPPEGPSPPLLAGAGSSPETNPLPHQEALLDPHLEAEVDPPCQNFPLSAPWDAENPEGRAGLPRAWSQWSRQRKKVQPSSGDCQFSLDRGPGWGTLKPGSQPNTPISQREHWRP